MVVNRQRRAELLTTGEEGASTAHRHGRKMELEQQRSRRTLLLFDFDHTLIDDNSDTWILKNVSPSLYDHMVQARRSGRSDWTALMDECVQLALQQHGETVESLKDRFRGIEVDPAVKRILLRASRCSDVHVAIVSDANEYYIRWILEWSGLLHCVDEIVTNPVQLDKTHRGIEVMRIVPLYGVPGTQHAHQCDHGCPVNMCKADILMQLCRGERFRVEKTNTDTIRPLQDLGHRVAYESIVYCGDGSNDYHPCMMLRADVDHILPREGYALMRHINSKPPAANVHPWNSFTDMEALITSLVPQMATVGEVVVP